MSVLAERIDQTGAEVPAGSADAATFDPNAELFGDWSWKPDRYTPDEGYVYTAEDIERVYPGRVFLAGAPSIHFPGGIGA